MLAVDLATTVRDGADAFEVAADLTVPAGETLCVLGPSGSGKSVLLDAIAGFRACEGSVELDGRRLDGRPPEDRGFGVVAQDPALFPTMTVRENVAFGARYHEDVRDPDDLLARLGVADLARRDPDTLSGGEAQRVALARALAVRPDAFLLDEPLAALDEPTRETLRADLLDLLAGETAVYVTHDRTTARALADRVAVLRDGRIEQDGPAEAVFERPASRFVAEFTGANCVESDALPTGLDAPDGLLAVRPEHVDLHAEDVAVRPVDGGGRCAPATVKRVVREAAGYRVTLAVGDAKLVAYAPAEPPASVAVTVSRERWHVVE